MEFKEYLKKQLAKPISNPDYDPNGNSERAIIERGLWAEILRNYKEYPSFCKRAFSYFDGWETPIAWFLQIPFVFLLAPILPIYHGYGWYKRAHNHYYGEYLRNVKNKRSSDH